SRIRIPPHGAKAGPLCARARNHAENKRTFDAQALSQPSLINLNSEAGSCDAALLYELRNDPIDCIDRNREAHPNGCARGGEDLGVDADEPPCAVEKRSARVPWIDGGICLDHTLYWTTSE